MADIDPDVYDQVDAATLTTTLLSPDAGPEVHRAALTALAERGPRERNPRLVQVLGAVLKNPTQWDPSVPEAIVDLFATDPSPTATSSMLEVLPVVLRLEMPGSTAPISGVRGYFYQALATRERDEDIQIWSEFLPTLKPAELASIILDKEAKPLADAIDPYEWLDQSAEPERTAGIFEVIAGAAKSGETGDAVQRAWDLLKNGANRDAYFAGVEMLAERYEQAKQHKRETQLKGLHAVLAVMDKNPRTSGEKLRGKRPWAP